MVLSIVCQFDRLCSQRGEKPLDVSIPQSLDWVNSIGKIHFNCGWHYSMDWGFGLHTKGQVSSLPAFIPICFLTRDTGWAATSSSCHLASPAMMACILQLWLKRKPSLSCFCCLFCQGSKKTNDYDRSLLCCLAGSTHRHVTPSGSLRSLGNRTETLRGKSTSPPIFILRGIESQLPYNCQNKSVGTGAMAWCLRQQTALGEAQSLVPGIHVSQFSTYS